jgi:hypothetical protein
MKAMGEEFDTDFHEALTNIPAPKPDHERESSGCNSKRIPAQRERLSGMPK